MGQEMAEPQSATAIPLRPTRDYLGRAAGLSPTGDILELVAMGIQLQAIASKHGIHNVFDDGGYKELLLLTLFDLHKLGREGDDAEDAQGRRYEIKTVARVSSSGIRKPSLSVTTEHTLTQSNIDRYRGTFLWVVAIFDQARPEAIYEIPPDRLEFYFAVWETKLATQSHAIGGAPNHLNNPKIPVKWILEHGTRVWPVPEVPLSAEVVAGVELAEEMPTLERPHDGGSSSGSLQ